MTKHPYVVTTRTLGARELGAIGISADAHEHMPHVHVPDELLHQLRDELCEAWGLREDVAQQAREAGAA